jgi:hypothetical protein
VSYLFVEHPSPIKMLTHLFFLITPAATIAMEKEGVLTFNRALHLLDHILTRKMNKAGDGNNCGKGAKENKQHESWYKPERFTGTRQLRIKSGNPSCVLLPLTEHVH